MTSVRKRVGGGGRPLPAVAAAAAGGAPVLLQLSVAQRDDGGESRLPSSPGEHSRTDGSALSNRAMGAPSARLNSPRAWSPRRGRSSPQCHAGRAAGSAHEGEAPDRAPRFREMQPSQIDAAWETVLDPWAKVREFEQERGARSPTRRRRAASPGSRSSRLPPSTQSMLRRHALDQLFAEIDGGSSSGLLSLAQVQLAVDQLVHDPPISWPAAGLGFPRSKRTARVREVFQCIGKLRGESDCDADCVRRVNRKEFGRLVDEISDALHSPMAVANPRPLTPPRGFRREARRGVGIEEEEEEEEGATSRKRAMSPTRSSANKWQPVSPRATRPARRDPWVSVLLSSRHSPPPPLPLSSEVIAVVGPPPPCSADADAIYPETDSRRDWSAASNVLSSSPERLSAQRELWANDYSSSPMTVVGIVSRQAPRKVTEERSVAADSAVGTAPIGRPYPHVQGQTQEVVDESHDPETSSAAAAVVSAAAVGNAHDHPQQRKQKEEATCMASPSPPPRVELRPVQRFPLRTSPRSWFAWSAQHQPQQDREEHQQKEDDEGQEQEEEEEEGQQRQEEEPTRSHRPTVVAPSPVGVAVLLSLGSAFTACWLWMSGSTFNQITAWLHFSAICTCVAVGWFHLVLQSVT